MCDYSLEAYKSRPAAVGEKLTLERFPSGSMGFTSPESTWSTCDTAVCVACDTAILLQGISEPLQKLYGIGPVEEVVMTRLETGPHKDAVRFSNGREISLQRLDRRISATVLGALKPEDGDDGIGREMDFAGNEADLVDADD